MKKTILILIFLLGTLAINATTYYVAPSTASPAGNDAAAGTIAAPWLHLEVAINRLVAGDILYMRGGTYRSAYGATTDIHNYISDLAGTALNPIVVQAYNDEIPIFNMDNLAAQSTYIRRRAFYINNCDYLTIKDLSVTKVYQSTAGAPAWGITMWNSDHVTFENVTVSYIQGYGFTCDPGNTYPVYINCDAHHCADPYGDPEGTNASWENANGFGVTGGDGTQYQANSSTPITYTNCRSWLNADDGFDFFYAGGVITVQGCWAFKNGYNDSGTGLGDGNGFKLGPPLVATTNVMRYVYNCVGAQNRAVGFTSNFSAGRYCPIVAYNNTTYDNGAQGITFNTDFLPTGPVHILKNNVMYGDDNNWTGGVTYPGTVHDHNTWDSSPSITVTDAAFVSVDLSTMDDARAADGSLPVINGLKLSSSSVLINKGVDVGIAYNSTAPDLGAFEYGAENPAVLATVITNPSTEIYTTTATGNGNVTNSGGATITERGVCWGTSINPTIAGTHATGGTGTGSYTVAITGLTKGQSYYVRAYATNSVGTAYGANDYFTAKSGMHYIIIWE